MVDGFFENKGGEMGWGGDFGDGGGEMEARANVILTKKSALPQSNSTKIAWFPFLVIGTHSIGAYFANFEG